MSDILKQNLDDIPDDFKLYITKNKSKPKDISDEITLVLILFLFLDSADFSYNLCDS